MSRVDPKNETDQVLEEHRQITKQVEDLEEILRRPDNLPKRRGNEVDAKELLPRLEELYEAIRHHFRLEESTILSNKKMREYPRGSRRIKSLRAEHVRINVVFKAVIASTRVYAKEEYPTSPRLVQWIQSGLIERMKRHERKETEFFQSLIYDEHGTGD